LEASLFYGIECHSSFQERLKQVPERILNFIIQDHSDYLQQISYEGKIFLGRRLGEMTDLHALELLDRSLESLVLKLIPDYSREAAPFVLIGLLETSS